MSTKKLHTRKNKTMKNKLTKNVKKQIICKFLEVLNTVKLYHWSTSSYSQHKATDDLYSDLNKYVDEFVEIMLGKSKERIHHVDVHSYRITNKAQFIKYMLQFKKYLIELTDVFHPALDSNLINIRDELLGALDKLVYLFELN